MAQRTHLSTCERKARFASKRSAEAFATVRQVNRLQRPYRCNICKNWHLGTLPEFKKPRRTNNDPA